ncbi:zinc finger, CCHC-type containing protein [Tanacetum coccineum]
MKGLNMLLDIVISDYNALCPIKAKSCTYWQLSHADYLLSLPFLMAATAQNTNNTTIRYEKKIKFVEQPTRPAPDPETADPDTIDKYYETANIEQEVACLMLSSMSPDLQRTLEKYNAYDMLKELKTMFEEQAKQELFETVKSYLDTLECLGYVMPKELGVSLILNSLNKDYEQFVRNYNMHNMGKTIAELHAILKLHEKGIPKKDETPAVLAIREGKIQKDKKNREGTLYATTARRWVIGGEIGLKGSRRLKHEALSLYVGNGMRAAVEAIGSFDLVLPSCLIIILDYCHYAPTMIRGGVSISCLVNNGYIHTFTNYGIFVSKDNVFYFNAIPHDGIYEIDMHNLYPNASSMFNVSNKRSKHALEFTYIWHCRLGHINKKHMDKLQRDEILQPTYDESLEQCKSCISGKMACKPFAHQVERAKDLLGLIHIDVCGPFRTVSREGASYFITFTDDFSRYDYAYLMKHKHEVFETFKACSFMLCDLDFEPLSLSLLSLPSCDLVSLSNILIMCLILKASNQSLQKSLSLNLELS